jgi:predicted AlkP superfamily phosphohydrolase/phosphomutase
MGGLYINDTLVTDTTERERLITELQKKLKALGAENDLPIKTHRPKELYDKTTDNSPDLLVRIDGVNIENAGWNRPIIDDCPERLSHQNGTHRRDGIFIAAGSDFESTIIEDAVTWDVAPTLLHLFAEPIPEAMDGRVLSEALSTDRSVTIRESGVTVETETLLDDDEEQEMQRQLGNLGYFE